MIWQLDVSENWVYLHMARSWETLSSDPNWVRDFSFFFFFLWQSFGHFLVAINLGASQGCCTATFVLVLYHPIPALGVLQIWVPLKVVYPLLLITMSIFPHPFYILRFSLVSQPFGGTPIPMETPKEEVLWPHFHTEGRDGPWGSARPKGRGFGGLGSRYCGRPMSYFTVLCIVSCMFFF